MRGVKGRRGYKRGKGVGARRDAGLPVPCPTSQPGGAMTKARIFKNIGEIGSLDYQRWWSLNGTAEQYLLLDELIERTIHAARMRATDAILSKSLSAEQREALMQFHDRVNELYGSIPWRDPNVSMLEIVEGDPAMRQIRDAANACLRVLGVSYSTEELLNEGFGS
jgi:hypothetical protein